MIPHSIHPDAEAELRKAVDKYDARVFGLGADFLTEVTAALDRIRDNPNLYAADALGAREAPIKRFSYKIVYLDLGQHVWIVAVAHTRRRSSYWRNRLTP